MELLRIVLMIGIVFGHGFRWGGVQDHLTASSGLYFIVRLLDVICIPAVNCFVMLSGYFLVDARFKISRILKLVLQIIFYSVVLYLVLAVLGLVPLSLKTLVLSFIPVISNRYWFATNYVALYLLCPFINRLLRGLDKRQYQVLLGVELFLFSLVSMIPGISGFNSLGGNSLIWFVVLYTLGGYLKRNPSKMPVSRLILCYAGTVLFMFLLSESVMWAATFYSGQRQAGSRITGYTSILCVLTSVLLFRIFEGLNVGEKAGRIINRISPYCFGVYLIHEHPYVRDVLWNAIGLGRMADRWWLPLGMIAEAILVFAACCVIEFLRSKLFSLIPKKTWDRADEKWDQMIACEL